MNAPLPIPPIWTTGTTEAIRTGTWRAAMPRHIAAPSPCHAACPVGGDIAEWIGHARRQDWHAAWSVLVRHNPFPAIAGRICHHPCESACNRAGYDQALSICKLERFVGDVALKEGYAFALPKVLIDQSVAVVGAGPSGLSAAYHLRRHGYRVTVFEAAIEPGGLMRHGIPSYRLSRRVLDGEIGRLRDFGIEILCHHPIADAQALLQLRRRFDAVYLAVGATRLKRLPVLDYSKPWVVDSAAYLAACNAGMPTALGHRVLVIGGGSAAMDAARSARRAGHAVTVLALESRAQMPSQPEEVAEALEEGITLLDGAMLTGASGVAGGVRLQCRRVRFEAGAQRGQFRIEAVAGSDFDLDADAVITAIGQDADLSAFGAEFPAAGALLPVDRHQAGLPAGQDGLCGLWAGGDVASMDRFVTAAVGMGERAAAAIDRALSMAELRGPAEHGLVPLKAIATWYHPKRARAEGPLLPPEQRLKDACEVQGGLDAAQAPAEAGRCFSCGTCIECDNCIHYCPDLAVERAEGGGYQVLGDYCKGCGLCVRECPTGSMDMVEELR